MPRKTTTARKPTSCLSRQQQRLASQRTCPARPPGSQANFMPLKTTWLVSRLCASQDNMARKPTSCLVRPPKHTVSIRCTQISIFSIFSLILTNGGVLGIPVCILPRQYQAQNLRRFPPNATPLSEVPSSFPVLALFRVPGSCPILALSPSRPFPGSWLLRIPWSCGGRGRCGLRRAEIGRAHV